MKIPTNLFKFSFIALGWIVFILLCYVAFKDEKTNVLITMKAVSYTHLTLPTILLV